MKIILFRCPLLLHHSFTDHSKGSHGNPGIYFKYDVSALKVVIKEDRENVGSFAIRLCSVIAGIVVICGFVNSIVQAVFDRMFGYLLPQYKDLGTTTATNRSDALSNLKGGPQPTLVGGSQPKTNLLLTNDMLHDGLASSQFIPFK